MKSICVVVLVFASFSLANGLTPEQERLIDEVVEQIFVPATHNTGLGLSIIQDGVTILSKGYGKRDIANDLNVDGNTLFSIGSISKSFTAVLVVKTLNEKFPELGEFALDTPIWKLAPNFNYSFSDRYRAESITFRDMLAHTTCLSSIDAELLYYPYQRTEYIYRRRYAKEQCPFRTAWVYNNAMFTLAGEIIAHIAQSGIEKMMLDLMGQLEMTGSWIFNTNGDYEDLPNMSKAYIRKQNQTTPYNMKLLKRVDVSLAAGGVISSPTDIAKYMNFHLNKGRVGNTQIIPETVMNWLYTASNILPPENYVYGDYAYSLGFFLSLYDGWQVVQHGGYWPPFHSELSLVPAKNLGIFTSSNGPGIISPPFDEKFLHAFIFDLLNNDTPNKVGTRRFPGLNVDINKKFEWSQGSKSIKETDISEGSKFNEQLDIESAPGTYGHPLHGDINIILYSNGTLQFNYGEWGIARLVSIAGSETQFLIEWETDVADSDYADGSAGQEYLVTFADINTLLFEFQNSVIEFKRDATLDTFPNIPWAPDSCTAQ